MFKSPLRHEVSGPSVTRLREPVAEVSVDGDGASAESLLQEPRVEVRPLGLEGGCVQGQGGDGRPGPGADAGYLLVLLAGSLQACLEEFLLPVERAPQSQ